MINEIRVTIITDTSNITKEFTSAKDAVEYFTTMTKSEIEVTPEVLKEATIAPEVEATTPVEVEATTPTSVEVTSEVTSEVTEEEGKKTV